MIAFKIVRVHSDGTYWSLIHPEKSQNYGIQYIPGQITKAEFGKLFVFDDLKTAIDWSDSRYESIWQVECDVLEPAYVISTLQKKENLISFWKDLADNKVCGLPCALPPPNSKLCNQLIMIARLK